MNHSKSGPFENRTKIDHSKSGHVRISDPNCNFFKIRLLPLHKVQKITVKLHFLKNWP